LLTFLAYFRLCGFICIVAYKFAQRNYEFFNSISSCSSQIRAAAQAKDETCVRIKDHI